MDNLLETSSILFMNKEKFDNHSYIRLMDNLKKVYEILGQKDLNKHELLINSLKDEELQCPLCCEYFSKDDLD